MTEGMRRTEEGSGKEMGDIEFVHKRNKVKCEMRNVRREEKRIRILRGMR